MSLSLTTSFIAYLKNLAISAARFLESVNVIIVKNRCDIYWRYIAFRKYIKVSHASLYTKSAYPLFFDSTTVMAERLIGIFTLLCKSPELLYRDLCFCSTTEILCLV